MRGPRRAPVPAAALAGALAAALAIGELSPGTVAGAAAPVLTVSGPRGIRRFTLAELRKWGVSEGRSGTRDGTGAISAPVRYRGSSLRELAEDAGLPRDWRIVMTAQDGSRTTLSWLQLFGEGVPVYDARGDTVAAHDRLVAILAWEREGRRLDPTVDGPLRFAFVTPGGAVTDGRWAVKQVSRVEVEVDPQAWSVGLHGVLQEQLSRADFEAGVERHGVTWTDGLSHRWRGIPLWYLLGRVDDVLPDGPHAFDDSLAARGYAVRVVSADGHGVSGDSRWLRRNPGLLVADQLDGEPLPAPLAPLCLVGDSVPPEGRIGKIVNIGLELPYEDRFPPADPVPGH